MKAESESGDPRRGLQRPRFDGGLARVPDPPQPGRWARCCRERRGSSQAALTSEHYGSPPTRGPSEKTLLQTPTPGSPSPSSLGGRFPADPGGAKLVPGRNVPSGLSLPPPPNLGFNVYFLIRMPATGDPPGGPSVGRWGPGKGLASTLPCPRLQGRAEGPPGPAGSLVSPLRVSDRVRGWDFSCISFSCPPPARPPPRPASGPLAPRCQEPNLFLD